MNDYSYCVPGEPYKQAAFNLYQAVVKNGALRRRNTTSFKRPIVETAKDIVRSFFPKDTTKLMAAVANDNNVADYITQATATLLAEVMEINKKLVADADKGDVVDIDGFRSSTISALTVLNLHRGEMPERIKLRAIDLVRLATMELRGLPRIKRKAASDARTERPFLGAST